MKLQRRSGSLELIFSLFASLLIVGAVLVWFLLPQMKVKNDYDTKLKAGAQLVEKLQLKYDRLYTQKQAHAERDNTIAEALENRAEEAAMQAWFAQFLSRCKVQMLNEKKTAVVTGNLQTPAALYELVDTLNEAPWVLKLQMPLNLLSHKESISATLHFQVVREEGALEAVQTSPGV